MTSGSFGSGTEEKPTKKKASLKSWIAAGVFLAIVIAIVVSFSGGGTSAPSNLQLQATIYHSDYQFTITNDNSFDWHNVDMQINPGIISNGFEYRTSTVMLAGHTYTIGEGQFANSDSVRFNSITYKVSTFYISIDNNNDGIIDGSGTWNFQ